MQSPVHKEENPTKLSGSRHFEYLGEDLKYNSLETERNMRTLVTSLVLCCKYRLLCKTYLVKVSPFILAPSTKATVAVKLWTPSLDTLLFIIIIKQYTITQGKTLPFLRISTQTVRWGVHGRPIFSACSAASINK